MIIADFELRCGRGRLDEGQVALDSDVSSCVA
jgi:hypothetical protein